MYAAFAGMWGGAAPAFGRGQRHRGAGRWRPPAARPGLSGPAQAGPFYGPAKRPAPL